MANPLFSKQTSRLNFAIIWIVGLVLQAGLMYRWFNFSLTHSLTDGFIQCTLVAGFAVLVSHNLAYYRPVGGRYFFILTGSAVLAIAAIYANYWLMGLIFKGDSYIPFLKASLPVRFLLIWIFLAAVSTVSILWYDMEEQQKNLNRKEAAEKMSKDAELFKLRQQLQPHFLFNSLNSINALIAMRPEEARQMVQKLSDFLRGTLKKEDQSWGSMKDELQYLQLYLDIEKVRFRHRLSTEITTDNNALELQIPPMLLQPVVENAIKFGLYDTTEAIIIKIKVWAADELVHITIQNPFDAELQHSTKGTGFGLSSIQRRLFLLFGRSDLLVTEVEGNLFTTHIKVPQPK